MNVASEISAALADRIAELCGYLLPKGRRVGPEWRCGSIYGEPGMSMGVCLRGHKAGTWRDFATSEGGDALDLVGAVLQLDVSDAIRWSRNWLGISDGSRADYLRPARRRTSREAPESEEAGHQRTARWLWARARPISGTLAETYLRQARGYGGSLPATLRFIPARGNHGPAMVAAFGIPDEPQPGRLSIANDAVVGIHLTRLAADGRTKAGTERDKIMLGRSLGTPIVIAAPNDLLGLVIAEGVENALSAYEALGLAAWAAGAASRMPPIADVIPAYIESVTIACDDDFAGRHHGAELARRLVARGIETRLTLPGLWRAAA